MFGLGIVMPLYPLNFKKYFVQFSICLSTYLFMASWAVFSIAVGLFRFIRVYARIWYLCRLKGLYAKCSIFVLYCFGVEKSEKIALP